MQIGAIVILYHPNNEVLENLASYQDKCRQLFIFDNTEGEILPIVQQISKMPNVFVVHDGKNEGIAKRLNQGIAMAAEAGLNWVLTMDQDSQFPKGSLEQYLTCAAQYPSIENVAMFGTAYGLQGSVSNACNYERTEQLITSGSLLQVNVASILGGFNEHLFIDEVDLAFCYAAIANGQQIVAINNIVLTHELGKNRQHRSLKSGKLTNRNLHSPFRIYYMVRNYFYVNALYPNQFQADKLRRKSALLNRLKNNLLYNDNRMQVVKYIWKGWRDYKRNRMGKL